jgi:hypothetical protein
MNEYAPWIEKGMTELEYFKDRYLDAVIKLEDAVTVIEHLGCVYGIGKSCEGADELCAHCEFMTGLEKANE